MENHDHVHETVEPRVAKAVGGRHFVSSLLLACSAPDTPAPFLHHHAGFTPSIVYLISPLHRILFCGQCIKDLLPYGSNVASSKRPLIAL